MVAKGDTILVERYQYARTDSIVSRRFSMAKTITALLIGIAVKEGAIRSIDDLAEIYVPDLKGTEYGRTASTSIAPEDGHLNVPHFCAGK